MPKYVQTTALLHSSHLASKVTFKILKSAPDVQAGLEKTEEPKIKLPTSVGS